MSREIMLIFLIAFALFSMQSIGGYFQIKDYKKAIRRVHERGNVGVGQKKGGFLSGYLVLIACDSDGFITHAERMEGLTFLTKFKPFDTLLGEPIIGVHIQTLLQTLHAQDKKKLKMLKGYIQALEALELRLYPKTEADKAAASII